MTHRRIVDRYQIRAAYAAIVTAAAMIAAALQGMHR